MTISHNGTVATSKAASPEGTLALASRHPTVPARQQQGADEERGPPSRGTGRSAARSSGPPDRIANGNMSSPATT